MKNVVNMRRNHTKWSIEQNPSTITIKRTEKLEKDGYFEEKETVLPSQTVRIFNSKSSTPQKVSTLAGEKQIDAYYGLLAGFEADIKAGTRVKDEFETDGMSFEVKAVFPQRIAGELVGYQCELERVK